MSDEQDPRKKRYYHGGDGGLQIDYEDQDPRIHAIWLRELARTGVPSGMGKYFDEDRLRKQVS